MDEYIWPKITKETTIEELKEIHRRIWDYVLTHDLSKPTTPYYANCVACEYAWLKYGLFGMCDHCPIKWPENMGCLEDDSLYYAFREYAKESQAYGRHLMEARQCAIDIRDIEWKDDNP